MKRTNRRTRQQTNRNLFSHPGCEARSRALILGLAALPGLALAQAPDQFTIPDLPEIVDLWLVDAQTDTRIARLNDYQTLNLAFLPAQLTIEAEADGDTQSVQFAVDGVPTSVHSLAPYALGPDTDGDFEPVPMLHEPGWVRLTATPFAGSGASGTAGPAVVRNLYRLKTDFTVNATADLGDTHPGDGKCEALLPIAAAAAVATQTLHADAMPRRATGAAPIAQTVMPTALPAVLPITTPVTTPITRPIPLPPPHLQLRRACTLRAAIEEANALSGRQTISIDGSNGQIYRITRGQLSVTDSLGIHGNGTPTIDAERNSRLMAIAGTAASGILVDLNDLDLANGDAGNLDRGGVLRVEQGTLQMFGGRIRGGEGNFGGGLYLQNDGHALLSGVIVSGNKAGSPESFGGGGVTQRGGGIFNLGGNLTIRNSAIVDNVAVRGGGLSNYGGLVRLENTSVLDNEARSLGGGLENRHNGDARGRMHISFSTITGNRAATSTADPAESRVGGGLFNAGWAYMASSVLAGNVETYGAGNPHTAPDCYSATEYDFKSYRNNVVGVLNGNCKLGDYSSGTTAGIQHGSDLDPLNPQLGSRFESPLPHRVPLSSSLLVDAGGTAGSIYPCPSTDQRGQSRPAGGGCDIGAVERQ